MTSETDPVMRDAEPRDVEAIARFGATYIPPHYGPLIGVEAAQEQVRRWWNEDYLGAAVARGEVVVAESRGGLVGVGQRGTAGREHVIYKLYVDPDHRGTGLGPRLIDALVRRLPPGVQTISVEQLAANERAGAFYEREGFEVARSSRAPRGILGWRRSGGSGRSCAAPDREAACEVRAAVGR